MKSHFLRHGIFVRTIMIISVLTIFTFSSCDKEDELVGNDNYYVKYVISSPYPRIFSNWSVTTPEGLFTKNGYQTRYWENTFGPIQKGFKCEVKVENGEPNINIYVSKNQEPFALKMTKEGKSASYIIDF